MEAFLGSRVHEALEKLYKDLMYERMLSLEDLLSYYESIWDKEWGSDVIIVNQEYDQDNYRRMGRRFLCDYYNRHHPFDESRTLGLEIRIDLEMDGVQIVGYIDRLSKIDEHHLQIHDYKTGNRLLTQQEADADRQLALYALMVKEMYPAVEEVDLVWHYLAFDETIVSKRKPSQLQSLKDETLELIRRIESCHDFPPSRSALCSWCEYQSICPEFKHSCDLKNESTDYSPEEGQEMVDRYASLKLELKEIQRPYEKELESLEESIVHFSQQHGLNTVYGSRHKVKVTKKESFQLPRKNSKEQEKLIAYLHEAEVWNMMTSLDNASLQEMLTKDDDFRAQLESSLPGLITKEARFNTRLSERKDVPEEEEV